MGWIREIAHEHKEIIHKQMESNTQDSTVQIDEVISKMKTREKSMRS